MDLHSLNTGERRPNRKRVGRGPGSGNGKTAGRGHKGQKSRAGYSRRAGFEGGQNPLHRRLPKRGFFHEKRYPLAVINLDVLEALFETGAEITTEAILARGVVHDLRGGIKVLGRGEITKKFIVKVQAASESAKQKIEAAGGALEIVAPAAPAEEV